ncbi:SprB repeat-containing protein, partial [Flavobacteriales bacterium]|nr:SprB repeat-containing protein [Flavobacteriales bacterium]
TVTDGAGCLDTFTFIVSEPDSLQAIITDTTDAVCSYSTNGQAIVTPRGGTPVFLYNWYDAGGDLDSVASGLVAGTYHVEVIDAKGCIDTGEVVVNAPVAIAIEEDSVPSTCSGICDGVALISVTGGTGAYTYDWFENGNIDNDSLYNICADTFSVKVTDINGCLDTGHVIVTQPVSIIASIIDTTNVNCNQGSDGAAVVTGSGGTLPYRYWWNDASNQTNDTAIGLLAGTYRVAVIDLNGCSDTTEIIISEPEAWNHFKDSTQASCYEDCDGQITVTPGGGTAPYTHSWTTGSESSTVINLCQGVYTDTITDARGCADTLVTYIFHPDSLQVLPSVINNVLCFGDSTAMAYASGLGGTAPYFYQWGDPIIYSGDTLSNMIADTFKVVITDSFGCTDANQVIFTSPTELTTSITDTVHANCICNASATVTPVGGAGRYTYLWNDLGFQTDSVAVGLCTGGYEVVVADINGCLDTAFVTIRDTSLFTISITDTTHVACNNICKGEAIVTPSLGKTPYTYEWSDPLFTTDSTVTGLCAGVLTVTVTDSEGCVRFENVTINEPDSLIGIPMFTSPSCKGDTNGIAWVSVSGGNSPYFHSWDTTSVNDTVYNVGIGTYTNTISDANGCLDTVSVIVKEPTQLTSRVDSINISCNGVGDGVVWSETTGGTLPYHYQWNDASSATTDSVKGLTPGIYTSIVTDLHGCSDTDSVAITEPLLLVSSITDTSHVSCLCTGVAIATPLGGTAPYTYSWNDPLNQTDSTATGLCAGNYTVNITDFNGCTDTSYVIIRDTSNFITSIVDTNMVSCNMMCNGSALARAENGVQPYSFTWNDPESTTDSLVNGLCAGSYTVNIADAIGCKHNLNVTITEPTAINIVLVDTNISCNGICNGSIEAIITGGTSPYSIDWNDPSLPVDTTYIDSLCVGPIEIEVNDKNGCVLIEKDTITEPADLIAFVNPFNHVSCFGSNDAELSTLPTGGTSPYAYSWSSGENSKKISGKGPGTYNVIITDTNNCSDFS